MYGRHTVVYDRYLRAPSQTLIRETVTSTLGGNEKYRLFEKRRHCLDRIEIESKWVLVRRAGITTVFEYKFQRPLVCPPLTGGREILLKVTVYGLGLNPVPGEGRRALL